MRRSCGNRVNNLTGQPFTRRVNYDKVGCAKAADALFYSHGGVAADKVGVCIVATAQCSIAFCIGNRLGYNLDAAEAGVVGCGGQTDSADAAVKVEDGFCSPCHVLDGTVKKLAGVWIDLKERHSRNEELLAAKRFADIFLAPQRISRVAGDNVGVLSVDVDADALDKAEAVGDFSCDFPLVRQSFGIDDGHQEHISRAAYAHENMSQNALAGRFVISRNAVFTA